MIILAAIGALSWLAIGGGRGIGPMRWIFIVAALGLGMLPPVARLVCTCLDRLGQISGRSRVWMTMGIAVGSAAYFVLTAFNQGRDLFPKTHDEQSYLIGMQMLARGRLWEPGLAVPDFFDSFYILVRPVYCSLYFPGTALLYVPTIWLHLPTWLMPALVAGGVVAAMYHVVTELADGAAGALAALVTAGLTWFRTYSILLTGHVPMVLMGLLLVSAWLQWRKSHALKWAAAIGALAGWAAIIRPADALIFAIPVGCAMGWEILGVTARLQNGRRSLRYSEGPGRTPENPALRSTSETGVTAVGSWNKLLTPAAVIAAAAPFLTLQIIFNIGVTGHAFQFPYNYYLERDQPGSSYGFHSFDPTARPQSPLPEKQDNYRLWVMQYLKSHTITQIPRLWGGIYFPMIMDTTLPCRALLLLAPIGVLGLSNRRRWIVAATLPLFLVIYVFNPFFLEHYALVLIPAIVLLVLLGGWELARAFGKWEKEIRSAVVLALVVLCATSFWEINRVVAGKGTEVDDETFQSLYLRGVETLADEPDIQKPAVVLFIYQPGKMIPEEPVYNTDVAWPDDAPIIRAHDLGPERNREIFEYYAKIQPDRVFYRFDWSRAMSRQYPLTRLGLARDLARPEVKPPP